MPSEMAASAFQDHPTFPLFTSCVRLNTFWVLKAPFEVTMTFTGDYEYPFEWQTFTGEIDENSRSKLD